MNVAADVVVDVCVDMDTDVDMDVDIETDMVISMSMSISKSTSISIGHGHTVCIIHLPQSCRLKIQKRWVERKNLPKWKENWIKPTYPTLQNKRNLEFHTGNIAELRGII
jgi:hypothetical protein